MTDYTDLKIKALEMSIKFSKQLDSSADIVKHAKEFEIYLRS